MKNSILLIGPLASGKSTIALKLSEIIEVNNYPVDRLKWYYRFNNGYNLSIGTNLLKNKGFEYLIEYANSFFGIAELKTILSQFSGVIDFGAIDTYCDNIVKYNELKSVFENYPNSFLILPTPNVETNISILSERLIKRYEYHAFKKEIVESYIEMNNVILRTQFLYKIAKHTIYIEEKDIYDLCREIISKLQ